MIEVVHRIQTQRKPPILSVTQRKQNHTQSITGNKSPGQAGNDEKETNNDVVIHID